MIATWGAYGPIYARCMQLGRDEQEGEHAHAYDHATLLAHGTLQIRWRKTVDDPWSDPIVFRAPDLIPIPAGILHEIRALEGPAQAWCVFSHRDLNGDVVQTWDGRTAPYV